MHRIAFFVAVAILTVSSGCAGLGGWLGTCNTWSQCSVDCSPCGNGEHVVGDVSDGVLNGPIRAEVVPTPSPAVLPGPAA